MQWIKAANEKPAKATFVLAFFSDNQEPCMEVVYYDPNGDEFEQWSDPEFAPTFWAWLPQSPSRQ